MEVSGSEAVMSPGRMSSIGIIYFLPILQRYLHHTCIYHSSDSPLHVPVSFPITRIYPSIIIIIIIVIIISSIMLIYLNLVQSHTTIASLPSSSSEYHRRASLEKTKHDEPQSTWLGLENYTYRMSHSSPKLERVCPWPGHFGNLNRPESTDPRFPATGCRLM
jgi:hypothetical protein